MKKRNIPEQELKKECSDILSEVEHWKDICENGCSDPFWPDGTNMNLTRNHIMYHKWKIEFWCAALGLAFLWNTTHPRRRRYLKDIWQILNRKKGWKD